MDHDGVWAIDAAPPPPLGRMMQPGTGTDTRRKKKKKIKSLYKIRSPTDVRHDAAAASHQYVMLLKHLLIFFLLD